MEDFFQKPKNYKINEGFRYVEDNLYCEEIRVCDLLDSEVSGQTISSPIYVYSKRQIETNINNYKTEIQKSGRSMQLNYAVKANMNPFILKLMKKHGVSLTLVSGSELRLALKLGFGPGSLVLNGNGKLDWEVDLACKSGVLVNVDSLFNLKQIIRVCQAGGYVAQVLFRINPDIDPDVHSYLSTGQNGCKFGITSEELEEVLQIAWESERIRVVGLHCHIGSTVHDVENFRQSTRILVDLFEKLRNRFHEMTILNLGGGLATPYKEQIMVPEKVKHELHLEFDNCTEPNKLKLYEDLINNRITLPTFVSMLQSFSGRETTVSKIRQYLHKEMVVPKPADLINSVSDILPSDTIAILEPGRSMVVNSAILLSRVLGTKLSRKKNYIVIDGSMTEIIRPCLYGAYHHIELAEPSQVNVCHQSALVWDIVGPVCESADFLGKDRKLVTPHEGCGIAVFDTGAYCSSMSSNYNMRVRPAELLIDGDKVEVIRKCETFENMMHCYDVCNTD
ncbi:uncharacterized protein LOC133174333 [Saccostrea echinata]|uniref:uncharacterized protein LOC133174333 n=1 Tax=Saccostrea echinata TaxID=191078 RepID=UPI002A832771|nr:uncharacterized protein LOC133174333 [Saccostrea echinata]